MLRPTLLRHTVTATALLLVLGACGSDTDGDDGTAPAAATEDAEAEDGAGDDSQDATDEDGAADDGADEAAGDEEPSDDETVEEGGGELDTGFFAVEQTTGTGTGTVTFSDGTQLTAPITCTIGQRELAGRELLYTATASGGDVQFDMTIYGDGGAVDAVVLNLTDPDGQRSSAGGPLAAGPFELTEVGATIAGTGTFKPGHAGDTDTEGEPRDADVLVECS